MLLFIASIAALIKGKYYFSKKFGIEGKDARVCGLITLFLSVLSVLYLWQPKYMNWFFKLAPYILNNIENKFIQFIFIYFHILLLPISIDAICIYLVLKIFKYSAVKKSAGAT